MERLWAPWRMEYILANNPENGCIFCLKSQEDDDGKNHILLRDRTCFALLNIYPYNNGHLMVAPYKHTPDLDELTESELSDLLILARRCQQLLRSKFRPDGFNVGINLGKAGGAGIIQHLHVHIVPRWTGDTNFMSTVGETRVLPQSLDAVYQELREAVATQ